MGGISELCPISGSLPCYPLTLQKIIGAGQLVICKQNEIKLSTSDIVYIIQVKEVPELPVDSSPMRWKGTEKEVPKAKVNDMVIKHMLSLTLSLLFYLFVRGFVHYSVLEGQCLVRCKGSGRALQKTITAKTWVSLWGFVWLFFERNSKKNEKTFFSIIFKTHF